MFVAGLSASVSFLPSFPFPFPLFPLFGSRTIFRTSKTPKILFLGLSLLPNPTETLATQANFHPAIVFLVVRYFQKNQSKCTWYDNFSSLQNSTDQDIFKMNTMSKISNCAYRSQFFTTFLEL